VHEQILLCHEFGMFARGAGQTLIPFQGQQLSFRPLAIRGIEQQFFRVGHFLASQARVHKQEYKCKYLRRPMRHTISRHGTLSSFFGAQKDIGRTFVFRLEKAILSRKNIS
jgi:hypothetical protein